MNSKDPRWWQQATVILLGHGTEENAGSAGAVRLQADELRRTGRFGEVLAAFWKQPPHVEEVLATVRSSRVLLVPLFMAEGYFAARVIPETLGFRLEPGQEPRWPKVLVRGDSTWVYCAPVGTHPKLADVVVARAEAVIWEHPFPRLPQSHEISLFLAGHGTERDDRSRQSVEALASEIRLRQRFAMVSAVFLDEPPRIADCYHLAQTRRIVMVPAFISDGLHTMEDIPALLGEPSRAVRARLEAGLFPWRNPTERHGRLVWYTRALGSDPTLQQVILERIREASAALADPKA